MSKCKQHFYFDESGDPNILGHHGKNLIEELQNDATLTAVPSIKNLKNGFHANKDCAEVRREVFKLLKTEDFEAHVIVVRKDEAVFREKFNMNKKRLYKYLVTELIKKQVKGDGQIDMYFASMQGIVSPL